MNNHVALSQKLGSALHVQRDEPTPKKKFEVRRYLLKFLVWKNSGNGYLAGACLQPQPTQLTPVGTDFSRICVGSGDTYLFYDK
jgi:hypothetical protein